MANFRLYANYDELVNVEDIPFDKVEYNYRKEEVIISHTKESPTCSVEFKIRLKPANITFPDGEEWLGEYDFDFYKEEEGVMPFDNYDNYLDYLLEKLEANIKGVLEQASSDCLVEMEFWG